MTDIERALASHRRGRWGRRYRLWRATVGCVTLVGWCGATGLAFVALNLAAAAGWEPPTGPACVLLFVTLCTGGAPAAALEHAAACLSGLLDRRAGIG